MTGHRAARIRIAIAIALLVLVGCGGGSDSALSGSAGSVPIAADLPVPPGVPTPARPEPFYPTPPTRPTTTKPTPTTPNPSPTTPAVKPADFLGIWQAEADHPEYGHMSTDLVFQADKYSMTVEIPQANYFFYMTGRWELYADVSTVVLFIEDFSPKEWCGPLGCTVIRMPDHEIDEYTFLDADTVRFVSDPCDFGGDCTVTYYRD